ncbi:MCP four helix bundle domain-containing protein [Actinoplanes sp. NPDC024001]|uniref:MCP four helix bundle domain-containing protein n=1 Tax=Actinoplanes sp. NPDC024001 TaxID=3154598 RepID=UPI00340E9B18
MVIGVIVSGVLASRALSRTAAAAQHLYHENLLSEKALAELQRVSVQVRVDLANLLISRTAADDAEHQKAVEDNLTAFDEELATYRAAGPAAEQSVIPGLEDNWRAYAGIVRDSQIPNGLRKTDGPCAGRGDVARTITGVAEAARSTSEGVVRAQRTTTDLSRMSSDLTALVSSFRY